MAGGARHAGHGDLREQCSLVDPGWGSGFDRPLALTCVQVSLRRNKPLRGVLSSPHRYKQKRHHKGAVFIRFLVVGRQPAPNAVEKTCYRRPGKLISPAGYCEKRGVDRLGLGDGRAVLLVDWVPIGPFNRVCLPTAVRFPNADSNPRPSLARLSCGEYGGLSPHVMRRISCACGE